MVELKSDDTNLSRRAPTLARNDSSTAREDSDIDAMEDKIDDVFTEEKDNESGIPEENSNPGLLSRLSGGVLNTASSAVGTAYGGVSWIAGGVWSKTGTAIGATYSTVSALSPVNLFRKQSKSKSD